MNPYRILAEAAKQHPEHSLLEVWNDFACWERARNYADDPNANSKEDIEWIQSLYGLAAQLQAREGNTRACRDALEQAAAGFAMLPHESQLYDAVVAWRRQRSQERLEERPCSQSPRNAS